MVRYAFPNDSMTSQNSPVDCQLKCQATSGCVKFSYNTVSKARAFFSFKFFLLLVQLSRFIEQYLFHQVSIQPTFYKKLLCAQILKAQKHKLVRQ